METFIVIKRNCETAAIKKQEVLDSTQLFIFLACLLQDGELCDVNLCRVWLDWVQSSKNNNKMILPATVSYNLWFGCQRVPKSFSWFEKDMKRQTCQLSQ